MTERQRIVVIGAGGHAREIVEAIRATEHLSPQWELLGVLADGEEHPDRIATLGVRLLGPTSLLSRIDAAYIVGVGDVTTRRRLSQEADRHGRSAANVLHPAAITGEAVRLQGGCYVAAGTVLTTNLFLGSHSHVNVGATVSHDCRIGSFCNVGPGARLAGQVTLGDNVDLGMAAVVGPRLRIGDRAVVGAGSTVLDDLPGSVTAVGTPARVLPGSHQREEK